VFGFDASGKMKGAYDTTIFGLASALLPYLGPYISFNGVSMENTILP